MLIAEYPDLRLFMLSLLAISCATAVVAAPVTYTCAVDASRANSWITPQLVIQHDAETGRVIVNDALIKTIHGQPIEGKVDTDNNKRVTFRWDLPAFTAKNGQHVPRFMYRATYMKATGAVSVSAQPGGYPNNFQAQGKCSAG